MNKKRRTLADLETERAGLKRRKKRVVFTNGCFDLLHAGHVRYLTAARALGDVLIVAVNSDRSVQRLKGPTRPITPLAQRMEVLAALTCVDYVVAFGGETPRKLIERLKPDLLVKGADWVLGEIVGREIVERYGGRVARIRMVPGVSTTALVKRIVDLANNTSLN